MIEADTERDHWMSAEEAKAYGLIDEVVTRRLKAQGRGCCKINILRQPFFGRNRLFSSI